MGRLFGWKRHNPNSFNAYAFFEHFRLSDAGMDSHTDFDGCRIPGFTHQGSLGFERSFERIWSRVECCGERIADDEEDISVV
jgi:hypothetical protein